MKTKPTGRKLVCHSNIHPGDSGGTSKEGNGNLCCGESDCLLNTHGHTHTFPFCRSKVSKASLNHYIALRVHSSPLPD